MSPNGRRAWRRAAKKLRRTMGRRWRSQEEWLFGKRWSEIVPNLEAHRNHITGAWFKRHGFTEQGLPKLDSPHPVRVYIGLWGTADGDGVEYAVVPKPFTARSIVGMTMGSRKRIRRTISKLLDKMHGNLASIGHHHDADRDDSFLRIGERLRPCPGCMECDPRGFASICDGSGVLPTGRS